MTTVELPKAPYLFFMKGLLTNLSNPKAVIYFGSVFSLFLANPQLDQVHWLLFIIVSVETILWFCFVTFIFSLPSFRVAYRNFSKWIDGISGDFYRFRYFPDWESIILNKKKPLYEAFYFKQTLLKLLKTVLIDVGI